MLGQGLRRAGRRGNEVFCGVALLAGLYAVDWCSSLHGDETQWLAPAAAGVAALAVAVASRSHRRRTRRPTIPVQRPAPR